MKYRVKGVFLLSEMFCGEVGMPGGTALKLYFEILTQGKI